MNLVKGVVRVCRGEGDEGMKQVKGVLLEVEGVKDMKYEGFLFHSLRLLWWGEVG